MSVCVCTCVRASTLCLCVSSLAFGNCNGLAVVDYMQKTILLCVSTLDLYGAADPYQRLTRSPRRNRQSTSGSIHLWHPSTHTCTHTTVQPHTKVSIMQSLHSDYHLFSILLSSQLFFIFLFLLSSVSLIFSIYLLSVLLSKVKN